MTNDAKLGMLAGVLGVIVAAVLFANTPPSAQSQSGVASETPPKVKPAAQSGTTPAAITPAAPSAHSSALPSSPVARTRQDVAAYPASRPTADEER